MKRSRKNLFALLLSLALLVSLLPSNAFAAVPDPPYTPLPPAIQPVGFENSSASLALAEIGRYDTGITSADGGVMEIVDYNAANGFAYAVNGHSGTLVAIPLQELAADQTSVTMLSGVAISVSEPV